MLNYSTFINPKLLKGGLLILTLFYAQLTFSQKNFVDGYVILNGETDSVKVKIDDQNWGNNPKSISVKSAIGTELNYSISSLSAFGIYGKEHYIIRKVNLDITPFSDNLKQNPTLDILADTTLALMVLLKADYSLLYFRDTKLKEHFFFTEKGKIRELINHKFIRTKEQKQFEVWNKHFQKQLDTLFSACEKKIVVADLEYDMKKMTDKFIEFNDCMGCSSVCYIKKKEEKNDFKFGLCVNQTFKREFQYYYNPFEGIQKQDKVFRSTLAVGMGISIYSKRFRGTKSMNFEFLYEPLVLKNDYDDNDVSLHYLTINVMYRKKALVKKNLNPFYGLGLNTSSLVSSKFNGFSPYTVGGPKNFSPKLSVELGLEVKHFVISTRVNYETLNSNYIYYEYKKVAEVIVNTNFSKLSSQICATYRF